MNVLLGINYWMKKLFRGSFDVSSFELHKMYNIKIVCSSLLIIVFLSSCSTLKSYGKYEKRWAYVHPFAAVKLKRVKGKCDVIYKVVKDSNSLDKYENGGKLDAFRHMFYMASFANKISPEKVRKLGIAHEKDNHLAFLKNKDEEGETADSLSCEMDLLNNEVGIDLAKSIKKNFSIDQIKDLCLEKINAEQAYFMKRNSVGNYLTCEGTIINFNLYIKKWNVPKCLVRK